MSRNFHQLLELSRGIRNQLQTIGKSPRGELEGVEGKLQAPSGQEQSTGLAKYWFELSTFVPPKPCRDSEMMGKLENCMVIPRGDENARLFHLLRG